MGKVAFFSFFAPTQLSPARVFLSVHQSHHPLIAQVRCLSNSSCFPTGPRHPPRSPRLRPVCVCMCMCLSICSAYLPFLSFDSVDFMRIMVRRGMAWHNLKVLVRLVPLILAFFGFRHQVGPPLQLHSAAIMLCSVLNALPKVGSEKTPNMYLVPVSSPHWQLSHSSLQCSPDPSSYVRENTSIPCVFGPPYLGINIQYCPHLAWQ